MQLIAAKLLIEFGHVVIPLGLVKIASVRVSKAILFGKVLYRKLAPSLARAVGELLLVRFQWTRLLKNEENVPMETSSFGRSRADVFREGFAFGYSSLRYVDHQPVMPLAILGVDSRWRIGVRHAKSIKRSFLYRPVDFNWYVLDLGWRQLIATIHRGAVCISHLCNGRI